MFAVLKRTKKSKNDLINAEEGEDHFTDISSVGEDDTLDTISAYNCRSPNCPTYTSSSFLFILQVVWLMRCSIATDYFVELK